MLGDIGKRHGRGRRKGPQERRHNNLALRPGIAARWLVSGCAAMLASGCANMAAMSEMPEIPRADIAVPARFSGTSDDPQNIPQDGIGIGEYWTGLGDADLTQFVQLAAANNFDIAQSAARLRQAQAGLAAARAGLLPNVSGTGGLRRDFGDFASNDIDLTAGVDADWEIDLFGRIGGSITASRADLAAAGYVLGDVQRLIIGTVANSTISARSIALQIAIARDTLRNQDDNLQIARWRLQAGLVSSLDVEQARVQRAQTAASIPLLESDLAATANAISTLIGEPPGRVLAIVSMPRSRAATARSFRVRRACRCAAPPPGRARSRTGAAGR